MKNKGCVSLVGAGCGNRELLTLKALERLENCDAVVYDDLIDEEILNAVPENCLRIYMGKRSGMHSARQEEISRKLAELAEEGKKVVRLKGGDPFVFGRGGEEIKELQNENIAFEVIPGISSAIAIPASAGIPVTHRGISRSFHVVAAHSAADSGLPEDLPELAKLHGTLIFLMGLSRLGELAEALQREGMDSNTPAAVISGGNSPNPAAVRGKLCNIAELSAEVKPPAVIVVGKTAAMDLSRGKIRHELDGVQIGLTGTDSIIGKLGRLFSEKGAEVHVVCRSAVERLKTPALRGKLCDDRPHWIVLTSANGARIFFELLRAEKIDLRQLNKSRFAVIGRPTGAILEEQGIYPELCPETYTSRELAEKLRDSVLPGENVIMLRADNGSELLPQILNDSGIAFEDIPTYRLKSCGEIKKADAEKLNSLDYIMFSSAGGVRSFFSEFRELPERIIPVCIGKVTAEELKKHLSREFITAGCCTAESMLEAVISDRKSGRAFS